MNAIAVIKLSNLKQVEMTTQEDILKTSHSVVINVAKSLSVIQNSKGMFKQFITKPKLIIVSIVEKKFLSNTIL